MIYFMNNRARMGSVDVYSIRRDRLRQLAKEAGSQAALAQLIEKPPNQISEILSGKNNLGERLARSIELRAGKPHGWLDTERGTAQLSDLSDEAIEFAACFESLPAVLKALAKMMIEDWGAQNRSIPGKADDEALFDVVRSVADETIEGLKIEVPKPRRQALYLDLYERCKRAGVVDAEGVRRVATESGNLDKSSTPQAPESRTA